MKAGKQAVANRAPGGDSKLAHAMAGLAFLAALAPQMPLLAQGLDSPKAVDTIIGSDVETESERAADDRDSIVHAIENTSENVSAVRKSFSLDKVEIVFVPDFESDDAIKAEVSKHEDSIRELRDAIEGNAMFFHAVDSRSAPLNEIIAVAFDDNNGVKIYMAGKPRDE